VLLGARAHLLAIGQHHLGLEQVVDREPALAGQVAEAAAEREPADARGRDDPAGRRQAVRVGRRIHLGPGAATADPDGASLGVDVDVAQQREVDHHAVVARAEPGAVVAAAADRHDEVVCAREAERPRDVVRARAARDQRRALVDHRVEEAARLLVVAVLRSDQAARESAQLLLRRARRGGDTAHASPP
jgi:hypothetical protein